MTLINRVKKNLSKMRGTSLTNEISISKLYQAYINDVPALLEYISQLEFNNKALTDNLSHLICVTGKESPPDKCVWQKRVDALETENAELRSRLDNAVVLPCKIGDTVYVVDFDICDWVICPTVSHYNHYGYTSMFLNFGSTDDYPDGYTKPFLLCSIGETVFLTREEAEQALSNNK
jgi:hypothetical protein